MFTSEVRVSTRCNHLLTPLRVARFFTGFTPCYIRPYNLLRLSLFAPPCVNISFTRRTAFTNLLRLSARSLYIFLACWHAARFLHIFRLQNKSLPPNHTALIPESPFLRLPFPLFTPSLSIYSLILSFPPSVLYPRTLFSLFYSPSSTRPVPHITLFPFTSSLSSSVILPPFRLASSPTSRRLFFRPNSPFLLISEPPSLRHLFHARSLLLCTPNSSLSTFFTELYAVPSIQAPKPYLV